MLEQVSKLRKMVEQQKPLPKSHVISVSSGKGGVGKTSFAVNFAIALSQRGKRVLVIDADFGLANIDVMLGVSVAHDLSSVISGEQDIRDIILEGHHGVKFISGGSGVYDLVTLDEAQVLRLLTQLGRLEDIAEIIIFDTGAGISDVVLRLVRSSNEAFVITTPEPTAIMDAYALIKTVDRFGEKPNMRLVVNMVSSNKEGNEMLSGFARVVHKNMEFELDKMGFILSDPNVTQAVKAQVPFMIGYPNSPASQNIQTIASKYLDANFRETRKEGLAEFLSRLLKRRAEISG